MYCDIYNNALDYIAYDFKNTAMKTKLTTFWYWFIRLSPFLLVLAIFLLIRSCEKNQESINNAEINYNALTSKLERVILKNGQEATEKYLFLSDNLNKQLFVKDDSLKVLLKRLKNEKVVVKIETEFIYDTIFYSFDNPIPYEFNRSFKNKDPFYTISGRVNQFGVTLNPPIILNTQRLVVSYKKGKPIISVTNSNKNIRTNAITGEVLDIPKKHWVIGVGGVLDILGNPTFGVFAGYKLFEF